MYIKVCIQNIYICDSPHSPRSLCVVPGRIGLNCICQLISVWICIDLCGRKSTFYQRFISACYRSVRFIWIQVDLYGFTWFCIGVYWSLFLSLSLAPSLFIYMYISIWYIWTCIDLHGCLCVSTYLDLCGCVQICNDLYRFVPISMV